MKKSILLSCFLLLTILSFAQNKNVIRITKIDSTETIPLDKFWKFHNGDDSPWAASFFDDSKWDTVDTELKFDKNDSTVFKGIAWFRIHIYIDSSFNEIPLCLLVEQDGASQLFLDGKLLHSLGTVSTDIKNEKKYKPRNTPFSFQYHQAGEHVLAVRYSNLNYRRLFEKYPTIHSSGFTIRVGKQDEIVKINMQNWILITSVLSAFSIFFFTLSLIHLLFFLFYRKLRTNLFYSVFVLLLGLLFFVPTITWNLSDPELLIKFNYYLLIILPVFFNTMLGLQYSLFRKKMGKYFWFSTAIMMAVIVSVYFFGNAFAFGFLFSFIISTVIASFSIVIRAIYKKIEGAWIVGTGTLSFLLFMAFMLTVLGFSKNFHVNGLIPLIFVSFAIGSIPISMSIYLAREFARTNKSLEKKLIEVETLSEKTIEQEKEKQKILETQKETLEVQVKERTLEVVEQKKLIEEKNKDITDSINYAKRIQEAILPAKEFRYKIFANAFILFKPKDIVSGDFYWFAEKNGKRLIASCDCTGHGVPGALMSMIGNNILNQVVNEQGITAPDEILNQLHKEIRKALKQGEQTETRDGMDISLITFNSETEIEFAGAQRPLWIIRNNSLEEIKADKFSIGGLQVEDERKFTKHSIFLSKGDSVYIFSDGFADQFGGTFMTKNFKSLLLTIHTKPVMEQEDIVNKTIENWKGGREQVDDILVIGIKI